MVAARLLLACCTPLALAVLATCAPPPIARATLLQLRARSEFDLDCPAEQLMLYHLGERTKGVAGCGRRYTYVEICDQAGGRATCLWRLDAPRQPAAPISWPPAPPPLAPAAPAGPPALAPPPAAATPPPSWVPCESRACTDMAPPAPPAPGGLPPPRDRGF
ncbi:MAG: hypothetical protein HY744_07100 [Deltaproteobacteria bacterium]|nr:hypothetical protein [Deltaproteobacteria bacterium]